jgi:mannose-6-phosphate isomerase-like protein (cupin superfamily)
MKPIDRTCAEHYVWGDACDGWHLVKRDGMSVIAERVPAGAREVRHFHAIARQFFFILSGCAVLEINGERFSLMEGQGMEVAPGISHQFLNESSEDVHFLVISHPSTRGDRVDA